MLREGCVFRGGVMVYFQQIKLNVDVFHFVHQSLDVKVHVFHTGLCDQFS